MKFRVTFICVIYILILTTIINFTNCENSTEPKNSPPTITIKSPSDSMFVHQKETIKIMIQAEDGDGTIKYIRIFLDDNLIHTNYVSPCNYELSTNEVELGEHIVKVTAIDNDNKKSYKQITLFILQPYETGSLTDIDGNVYKTIQINGQWWMNENLKVRHYNDGTLIPKVENQEEWYNFNSGAYCIYDNNDSNANSFGFLYNWYVIRDSLEIAPTGWHVPSDHEYEKLFNYLGQSLYSSSFSVLMGGYRSCEGKFYEMGNCTGFWTSDDEAWHEQAIGYQLCSPPWSGLNRFDDSMRDGWHIRCIKNY